MKLCEVCGSPEHPVWKAHVFATNRVATNASATNRSISASNSAGFLREQSNGNRKGRAKGHYAVSQQSVSRSGEAVAEVGAEGAAGVQRGVQHDVEKPVDVPASAPRKDQQEDVANDRMERSLDCGGCSEVKTLNRRSRATYNAYQREYMARRRAKAV